MKGRPFARETCVVAESEKTRLVIILLNDTLKITLGMSNGHL